MSASVTHIEKQRKSLSETQSDVMKTFKMSEGEYLNIFYESGCSYLKKYEDQLLATGTDCPEEWRKIRTSPIFWKWWRIQYALKDEELVKTKACKIDYFEAHAKNPILIPGYIFKNIDL